MTTTVDTQAFTTGTRRVRMDAVRRSAFLGGLFYLITFASSIPAVFLLAPVLNDQNYIVSSGADTQVVWGNILDLVNALNRSGVGGLNTDISSPNFGRLFGIGIGARRLQLSLRATF